MSAAAGQGARANRQALGADAEAAVRSSKIKNRRHPHDKPAGAKRADLAVLHVVESLDLDIKDAYEHSLRDEVESAFSVEGATGIPWVLHLATAQEDVAETILDLTKKAEADLLVIGARRRSPVGKLILGSVTQTLILEADVPVLVVKSAT